MESLNMAQPNPSLKAVRSVIAVGLAILFLVVLLCATTTSPAAASLQAIDDGSTLEESEQNVKYRTNDGAEQNDEPVVMLGTHHGGLWALMPEVQGDGDVEFNWAWDSAGIGAAVRSIAIVPYPDGAHDYYAVAGGGGILRMRAQDDVARWIGPDITGTTNWMGYGVSEGGSGAIDVDRVHGDVVCAALGYAGTSALGQSGIYCSYPAISATAEMPAWQRINPAGETLLGGFTSRLVVIPRPDDAEPEQTAVVVGVQKWGEQAQAWRYVWDSQLNRMDWRSEQLPISGTQSVISAQVYPRPGDDDRFTVFFATANIECLWGLEASDCENGAIIYRDFDRRGEPLGAEWVQLDRRNLADGCNIHNNLIWDAHTASTARWLASWPEPSEDVLFFSGGAWNAGALGMFTSRCLVRVEPGDTPDDPYEIVGFPDDNLADYQIRAASMAPSPDAGDGWRLYVLAMCPPAESEYERTLVDFEIFYSDDYGDSFTSTVKIENKSTYAFANITVVPGWSEDESGARGMYLSSNSILSTPSGLERELLPGAYGGNSTMFGSGVTADGLQVSGLSVRDGNAGEWQSSLDMAPHAVAVGREHVYFSSWPFSRAPGMMTDGGGLYEVDPADILEHAALGDESIPELNKVWDPAVHPCTITVPSNPFLNPPPIAHYIAVDPKEEQVFAIMRKAGAGYDYWADPNECGNGLWVAHRPDEPSEPWTWELLIKEESGPVFNYLWVVSDAQGDFRYLIVGLSENNNDYPNLREQFQQPFLRVFHDEAGWTHEEIDVGLASGVPITTCRGAGFDYDKVETDYWVMTVACGDSVDFSDDTQSYLRLSNDAGVSFVPWGAGSYDDKSLGATVLYRYPNGERRLFVHLRGEGVMVQTDTQDPGSLTLIQDELGRLSTTTGASTLNLMWPPPSPVVKIYLPIVLNNLQP